MAVTTDFVHSTTYTLGVSDITRNRSVRTGKVTGLPGLATDWRTAATEVVTSEGEFHNGDTVLPLDTVTIGPKYRKDRHTFSAVYAYSATSDPPDTAENLAKVRGFHKVVEWPTGFGFTGGTTITGKLPSGQTRMFLSPSGFQFKPIYVLVTMAHITVDTVLDFDPCDVIEPLLGTMNSNAITMARCTRDEKTVLFHSANITPVRTYSKLRYVIRYNFLYREGGHIKPDIDFEFTDTAGQFPVITIKDEFPTNGFDWNTSPAQVSNIPTHDRPLI